MYVFESEDVIRIRQTENIPEYHSHVSLSLTHRKRRRAVVCSNCCQELQQRRNLAHLRPCLPHTSRASSPSTPRPPPCTVPWLQSWGQPEVTVGPGRVPSRARCRALWAWSLCTESPARWIWTSLCLHQHASPARPPRSPSDLNPNRYPERGETPRQLISLIPFRCSYSKNGFALVRQVSRCGPVSPTEWSWDRTEGGRHRLRAQEKRRRLV